MMYNIDEPGDIYTPYGSKLNIVTDFKYLGLHTECTEADINARKGSVWKACNKLKNIWKSSRSRAFKICLF